MASEVTIASLMEISKTDRARFSIDQAGQRCAISGFNGIFNDPDIGAKAFLEGLKTFGESIYAQASSVAVPDGFESLIADAQSQTIVLAQAVLTEDEQEQARLLEQTSALGKRAASLIEQIDATDPPLEPYYRELAEFIGQVYSEPLNYMGIFEVWIKLNACWQTFAHDLISMTQDPEALAYLSDIWDPLCSRCFGMSAGIPLTRLLNQAKADLGMQD